MVARALGPLGRGARFVRRHKVGTATASVLLLAVLLTAVFVFQSRAERQKRIAVREERITAPMNQSNTYYRAKNWHAASDVCLLVLAEEPGNFMALGDLAIVRKHQHYLTGDPRKQEAEQYLNRALANEPGNVGILNFPGVSSPGQGRQGESCENDSPNVRLRNIILSRRGKEAQRPAHLAGSAQRTWLHRWLSIGPAIRPAPAKRRPLALALVCIATCTKDSERTGRYRT